MAEIKLPKLPKDFGKNTVKKSEAPPDGKGTMKIVDPKDKPFYDKLARVFFDGDLKDVKSYLTLVMIDHVKDALVEGFRILVRGGNKGNDSYYRAYDKPSYASYYYSASGYSQSTPEVKKEDKKRSEVFDPRNVIFSDRVTCELVLRDIKDIISQTGSASVSDFFKVAKRRTRNANGDSNLPTPDWAATDFGWVSIEDARPVSCKDGYFCSLPTPYPIN